jgi:hypothetical protein
MEIAIRIIMFVLSILSLIFSFMALEIENHSPSKETKRLFKKTLKRCKKEHKKAKDYEDCSYCLWNEFCKCGKKSKGVKVDGFEENS